MPNFNLIGSGIFGAPGGRKSLSPIDYLSLLQRQRKSMPPRYDHPPFASSPPQICEYVHQVARLIFWYFRQPTAKTPAPIFTINTLNDAVSPKDVPFGGLENKILHFDLFSSKRNFVRQFSTEMKISRQKGFNDGDARL